MASCLLHPSPSPSPRPLLRSRFTISKSHSSLRFSSSPSSFNPLPLSLSSSRIRSSTPADPDDNRINITDEWGEKAEPEELQPKTTQSSLDSDPPQEEDEWGRDGEQEDEAMEEKSKSSQVVTNGSLGPTPTSVDENSVRKEDEDKAAEVVADLKRCLVDSVYGLNLGFNASLEVRAEVLELVNQLEALNPTPNPVERADLLDGNWVLLYTAFSELLPLLALGSIPLLKVEKITQDVDTSTATIVNSITLSSPFAISSFSASASFEVRTPTRIQVVFKEGSFKPPEIKPTIDLPQNLEIFGQTIPLSPLQQSLTPLQDAVATISRTISGLPPLKVPIPGERSQSWLLITYLDEDLRIARGDGGLFVLAREGSPLLDQ